MNTQSLQRYGLAWLVLAMFGLFILGVGLGWWLQPDPTPEVRIRTHASLLPVSVQVPEQPQSSDVMVEPVLPSDFLSQIHAALAIPNRASRQRTLFAAVDGLNASQIQDAIERLQKTQLSGRNEILIQLFARWGESDPEAAMKFALSLSNVSEGREAANAVLNGWVERDPSTAERWVAELPDGLLKNSANKALISAAALKDPKHAFNLAQNLDLPWDEARDMAAAIFEEWAAANPLEAAAHAGRLPAGQLRTQSLSRIAKRWAELDLPNALAWARSLPEQDLEIKPLNSIGLDPIHGVLDTWIKKDSAAAVNWLSQLPEGQEKAALVSNACTFLDLSRSSQDPQLVVQLAMMVPEGSRRDNMLEQKAHDVARHDPSGALSWVKQQADPHVRQVLLKGLISHLSGDDLRNALDYAQSLAAEDKEGLVSTQMATGAGFFRWRLSDPAAVASWAVRQPNNQEYIDRVTSSWVEKDPDRATEWLQTLPVQARDTALQRVVNETLARIPVESAYGATVHLQKAERWISQLSQPQQRQKSYEMLGRTWMDLDPGIARNWITASSLPQDVKQRLLEIKPAPIPY